MFTLVEAKNFKSFGGVGIHLDLAPLTILLGPNGSGKTSALDAIALLAQTAETPPQGTPFTWKGQWLDLGGDGQYALYKRDAGAELTLSVGLTNGQAMAEWRRTRNWPEVPQPELESLQYLTQYCRRSDESLHRLVTNGIVIAERQRALVNQLFTSRQHKDVVRYPNEGAAAQVEFHPISSPVAALSPSLFQGSPTMSLGPQVTSSVQTLSQLLSLLLDYLSYTLANKVFVVGPDRAPKRAPLEPPRGNMRVGRNGEFTLALLSIVFARPEYGARAEKIREWARIFGLEKLSGGWTGEKHLQAGYYDSRTQTPLPTEYAGFGSQQLLPVIVQVFAAPHGSLVMIEEPEISLHPEAQLDLIKMFADAIHAGQQILITTHSQTLLLGLSAAAKEYGLKPENVAVYHFSREGEEAIAKRLELDSNWYIKGWVPSFSEVESRLIKQWSINVGDKIQPET
jgi:energy-coupling factor transporter ATP-binding protein EcfA2